MIKLEFKVRKIMAKKFLITFILIELIGFPVASLAQTSGAAGLNAASNQAIEDQIIQKFQSFGITPSPQDVQQAKEMFLSGKGVNEIVQTFAQQKIQSLTGVSSNNLFLILAGVGALIILLILWRVIAHFRKKKE